MPQEIDNQTENKKPLEVKRAPFEKQEILIEWEAPIRVFEAKNPSWFAGLVILTLALFFLMAFWGQWILGFLVLALAFVVYTQNKIEPTTAFYKILTTGIKIDEKTYDFDNLSSFWIDEEKDQKILVVSTWLNFPPKLVIVIPKDKQDQIEKALLKYIPYREKKERDYAKVLDSAVDFVSPRLPSKITDFFEKLTLKLSRH